jgi:hypothetical protein
VVWVTRLPETEKVPLVDQMEEENYSLGMYKYMAVMNYIGRQVGSEPLIVMDEDYIVDVD